MEFSCFRTIPQGAKDQQRTKGETVLPDLVVTRLLDKASPAIALACAEGQSIKDAEIEMCSTIDNVEECFFEIKIKYVILSHYRVDLNAHASPLPTETLSMNYTTIEWKYVVLDPDTGQSKGSVTGGYDPSAGKST